MNVTHTHHKFDKAFFSGEAGRLTNSSSCTCLERSQQPPYHQAAAT